VISALLFFPPKSPDVQHGDRDRSANPTIFSAWRTTTLGVACVRRRRPHSLSPRHVCPRRLPRLSRGRGPCDVISSSSLPAFKRQLKNCSNGAFPTAPDESDICLHVFTCAARTYLRFFVVVFFLVSCKVSQQSFRHRATLLSSFNKQTVGGRPPRYAPPLSSLCGRRSA